MRFLDSIVSELRRRILGISPEEIRYTFDDVRGEIRALRTELKAEIVELHRQIDALPSRQDRTRGPELPVAEA
jgi:hypothetical protein